MGSDSVSHIVFEGCLSQTFNIFVAICVAYHPNLCHVAVPNSLVSLHVAVHGLQDGQSDIDFSCFWRSSPDKVPWRPVIWNGGTIVAHSTCHSSMKFLRNMYLQGISPLDWRRTHIGSSESHVKTVSKRCRRGFSCDLPSLGLVSKDSSFLRHC